MSLTVPRAVRGALVAAATALATTADLLATASSAEAASGYDRCARGQVCVFSGSAGTGSMMVVTKSLPSLGAWDDHISSIANYSTYTVCLSSEPDYELGGRWYPYEEVSLATSDRPDLDNDISSIELLPYGQGSECGLSYYPVQWYDQEPRVRPSSSAAEAAFGDLNGDGRADLLARNRYSELWYWAPSHEWNVTDRFERIGTGWTGMSQMLRHGDYNGDGIEDVFARDKNGVLWFYPGTGFGTSKRLGTRVQLRGTWNGMRDMAAAGDLNCDGRRDLLAVDAAGVLWSYPGNGKGSFGTRKNLGGGWGVMNELVGAGDMNSDHRSDLVARDTTGRLWLYPGNGRGGFGDRHLIGTGGWNGFKELAGVGDYNGDGHPDLLAHAHQDNSIRMYPGTGASDGHLGRPVAVIETSDAHLVF
ncbi:FG-GAP-like repeat-containing protein [Streptomyces sp. NBC_00335]|uniref:FG-GAP-like repeat-containing protein n=1 Tax=unclassified Streptomyces TaxID=2593676 RepID=UPI002250FB7C|nr:MULTISPECIES: FG-GAP-like repeat-containing protein [unclassified Streptomyces]MCX5409863.1 FG-GAP-like repeat-containing protein [Streptomyces sp. NBC_00086]